MESQYNEASEIISSEKQRLLESFPEDDRGDFENLNLTQLRKIHNKLNVKDQIIVSVKRVQCIIL